jgi:hypothetical protein
MNEARTVQFFASMGLRYDVLYTFTDRKFLKLYQHTETVRGCCDLLCLLVGRSSINAQSLYMRISSTTPPGFMLLDMYRIAGKGIESFSYGETSKSSNDLHHAAARFVREIDAFVSDFVENQRVIVNIEFMDEVLAIYLQWIDEFFGEGMVHEQNSPYNMDWILYKRFVNTL